MNRKMLAGLRQDLDRRTGEEVDRTDFLFLIDALLEANDPDEQAGRAARPVEAVAGPMVWKDGSMVRALDTPAGRGGIRNLADAWTHDRVTTYCDTLENWSA